MGAFSHVSSTTIRPETLIRAIGTERAPLLVDVRRRAAFDKSESVLPAAFWRDHRDAPAWAHRLEAAAGGRGLVVYCVHGEQVSLAAASLLRQSGVSAKALVGGFDGYVAAGGPLVARTTTTARPRPGRRPASDPESPALPAPGSSAGSSIRWRRSTSSTRPGQPPSRRRSAPSRSTSTGARSPARGRQAVSMP